MSHSAAWDKTTPLGTDLASSIDNFMRDMKRDVEERMQLDHIWAESLDDDGKHRRVTLVPDDDVIPFTTETPNEITGSTVGGLFDLEQTWNTSGLSTGFMMNIVNTASHADSALMDLKVDGVTVFKVDMTGEVTVGSIAGSGLGNVNTGSNFSADNLILRSNGASKNIQDSVVILSDAGDMTGIRAINYTIANVFSWNNKSTGTIYQATSDGFVIVNGDGVVGVFDGTVSVVTDASSPPSVTRGKIDLSTAHDKYKGLCIPVQLGHYWRVNVSTLSGTPSVNVYWVPFGSGGI